MADGNDRAQRLYSTTRRVLSFLITNGPATTDAVATAIGSCNESARQALNWWHEIKMVHVHSWDKRNTGPARKVYAAGPGKDALSPKPLSASEKCRRWRATAPNEMLKANARKIQKGMTLAGLMGMAK